MLLLGNLGCEALIGNVVLSLSTIISTLDFSLSIRRSLLSLLSPKFKSLRQGTNAVIVLKHALIVSNIKGLGIITSYLYYIQRLRSVFRNMYINIIIGGCYKVRWGRFRGDTNLYWASNRHTDRSAPWWRRWYHATDKVLCINYLTIMNAHKQTNTQIQGRTDRQITRLVELSPILLYGIFRITLLKAALFYIPIFDDNWNETTFFQAMEPNVCSLPQ